MNETQFIDACKKENVNLTSEQIRQFRQYMDLLLEWNQKMNLTRITDPEEVYSKHFFDSVAPFFDREFESLCDVGTGAGFPGIPVSILYPEKSITLVEPLQKRCRFLQEVKETLGLSFTILNARSEELPDSVRESFDVVTSRAVARLSILLELCVPLAKVGGWIVALKGKGGQEELQNAQQALKLLACEYVETKEVPIEDAVHQNIYIRKMKKTSPEYPRNFGQIKKKPLGE